MQDSILDRWNLTPEELTQLVDSNPSMRGMLFGYVAEVQLKKYIDQHPEIDYLTKYDDHDRTKKGDLYVSYKGFAFDIEAKSIQTNTIKQAEDGWTGKAQVDASDRRVIKFDDGSELNTTLLTRGEFDILAVNCFGYTGKWDFLFCKNENLPHSTYKKYTQTQRDNLIASLIPVHYPAQLPFTDSLTSLLDSMIDDGTAKPPRD